MIREDGMFGIVLGRWMIGLDWGRSYLYAFVFDMESCDDVWRSRY